MASNLLELLYFCDFNFSGFSTINCMVLPSACCDADLVVTGFADTLAFVSRESSS